VFSSFDYPHNARRIANVKRIDKLKCGAHIADMIEAADIKRAREQVGETQAVFARRFGIDQSTLHRWETDGPRTQSARVLAEYVLQNLGPVPTQAAE
jgi:DNA-binding transcriptional regulator YiaG